MYTRSTKKKKNKLQQEHSPLEKIINHDENK